MKRNPIRSQQVLNVASGKIVRGLLCIFFRSVSKMLKLKCTCIFIFIWIFVILLSRLLHIFSRGRLSYSFLSHIFNGLSSCIFIFFLVLLILIFIFRVHHLPHHSLKFSYTSLLALISRLYKLCRTGKKWLALWLGRTL